MKNNIDEIIESSMKKTEEFQKKLQSVEDKFNLNNVFMVEDDANCKKINLYSIDGQEFTKK